MTKIATYARFQQAHFNILSSTTNKSEQLLNNYNDNSVENLIYFQFQSKKTSTFSNFRTLSSFFSFAIKNSTKISMIYFVSQALILNLIEASESTINYTN